MKQTDRSESGAMPRQKFDETYKRHAVELTLHGDRTVKTVAKELGLPSWQLYEWRKIYAPRPGDGGGRRRRRWRKRRRKSAGCAPS
jgi:transposase-like protein